MFNIEPTKSLYQIFVTTNDKVILDAKVIAFDLTEAVEKVKIGSVLKELGVAAKDIELYIGTVGFPYQAEHGFPVAITKTPELTADEKAKIETIKSALGK